MEWRISLFEKKSNDKIRLKKRAIPVEKKKKNEKKKKGIYIYTVRVTGKRYINLAVA